MTWPVTPESWHPRKAMLGSSRADSVNPALTLPLFGQSRFPGLAKDLLLTVAHDLRVLLDECIVTEDHARCQCQIGSPSENCIVTERVAVTSESCGDDCWSMHRIGTGGRRYLCLHQVIQVQHTSQTNTTADPCNQ